MTIDEVRTARAELVEILHVSGLDWVVQQVQEACDAGREVDRPIRIPKEHDERSSQSTLEFDAGPGPRPARKTRTMLSIEPFSERAQLLLLLAGLREAIVRAAEIEYECFRLLQQVGDLKAIVFEPSEQPDDRKVTRLTGERDERVQVLDKLILQFEREVSG